MSDQNRIRAIGLTWAQAKLPLAELGYDFDPQDFHDRSAATAPMQPAPAARPELPMTAAEKRSIQPAGSSSRAYQPDMTPRTAAIP